MGEQLKRINSSLTLALAARIVDGAIAARKKARLLPLAVAVLDAGGNTERSDALSEPESIAE